MAGNFADEVTHSYVVVTEVMKCSYHADLHLHGPHILPLCSVHLHICASAFYWCYVSTTYLGFGLGR